MDTTVANLSASQRKIGERKEKTKNALNCTAKASAGVVTLLGVGGLASAVDTFDPKNAKGFKGKFLSTLTKNFEKLYNTITTLFKENITNFTDEIKDMSKASKGGLMVLTVTGVACILNTIIALTKAKEKSNQIEQKYN